MVMHALVDFCYLAQALELDDDDCSALLLLLHTFHDNKAHVIKVGGWRGKKKVIMNWYIPKLELLQNVMPSIHDSGALAQWTADITEHAHILMIKNPACQSNNIDIDPQICRYLDRLKKCSRFELATSLRELGNVASDGDNNNDNTAAANTDGDTRLFWSIIKLGQPKCSPTNYFSKADHLLESTPTSVHFPLCTFLGGHTAINVARDPKTNRSTINHIAVEFQILDLHAALGDYIQQELSEQPHTVTGPCSSPHDCHLPFTYLAVWHSVHLQQTPFYSISNLDPT